MFRRLLLVVVVVMMASSASADVVLRVDFNSNQDGGGDSTTAGDPGLSAAAHNQAGWSSYHANHEVAAEFSTANYGGITLTPAWPNTTDNRVQQSIDRGATNDDTWNNAAGDLNLVTDFIGIDTRTGNGGNGDWDGATGTPTYMTLTLGGLGASLYQWTSFHHDTENVYGPFAVWISTDGGSTFTQLADGLMTDGTEGGSPDSGAVEGGPDAYLLPSTYRMSFTANGADDVVIRFAPYSGEAVHRQIWGMNGFVLEAVQSELAFSPIPTNGATYVEKSVILSWQPGESTATTNGHKLFFSDDFADVNNGWSGAEVGILSNSVFDTAMLDFTIEYGTTYYWRVDQAGTPGGPWQAGNVWSFTIEPYSIAIPAEAIKASASTIFAGTDPNNTFNGSGLDEDDLHSMADASMWLSAKDDSGAWIEYEFDKAYRLHEMHIWNHNTVAESAVGWGIREAKIEYSVDGTTWTTLGATHEFVQAPGTAGYAYNTAIDFGDAVAKYVRITANSNWGGVLVQYGLSEVRFMYMPVWARSPEPADGKTNVALDNVTLSWRPGREAASSDLFFSNDKKAVIDETVDAYGIPLGESHDTGRLELGETYYWKVNAVNNDKDPSIWEGELWSFDTLEFLIVDDIEDYNNTSPATVWDTWVDGYNIPANGSQVGHELGATVDPGENYAELAIVHGDSQSMPFYYNNVSATVSEAVASVANLPIGHDWTVSGIKTLALWFYGDPNNPTTERMYVKLNGVKVVYDGDLYDFTRTSWKQWNIDLAAFAGVDMSNVTEIAIGLERTGGAGGSGLVYIDDIRLYPARCIASLGKPDADLNSDCVVDLSDMEIMASQWLSSGLLVTPQEPSTAGLVSHWEFEGNVDDSIGANHATTTGGPTYVAGQVGQAIEFDGLNDYALVQGTFDLPVYSASLWFRVSGGSGSRDLFSVYNDAGAHGILIELQSDGTLRLLHRAPLDTGGGTDIRLSTTYDDGLWHHAAIVKSSDTASAYVNGELVSSLADTTAFGEVLQNIAFSLLKHTDDTLGRYFAGSIDDARLYNRALSAGEVASLAGKTEVFSEPSDLDIDGKIDFKDFATLAAEWMDELLWPQP